MTQGGAAVTERADRVAETYRRLPVADRERLRRAADSMGMSIDAAFALGLARQRVDEYAPPDERAKVATLMRLYLDEEAQP